MRKSHNIWIPSKQSYYRFYEMTVTQYRVLLKSMHDKSIVDKDLDFVYTMNALMQENIVGDINVSTAFTVLDRFVYFLAEKIRSCNSTIKLSCTCEKCDTTSSIPLNLTNLVGNVETQIDRSFQDVVDFENFRFICDLPTLANEYDILEYSRRKNVARTSYDFQIDNRAITFIKSIQIGKNIIQIHDKPYRDKLMILQSIPAGLIKNMHDMYINVIGAMVNDIRLIDLKCPGTFEGQPCGEAIVQTFDIYNVNDMVKLVYADHSPESLLIDMYRLSSTGNMAALLDIMTPKELLELLELSSKNESELPKQDKKEFDMLEQYRQQNGSQGMTESPSEF